MTTNMIRQAVQQADATLHNARDQLERRNLRSAIVGLREVRLLLEEAERIAEQRVTSRFPEPAIVPEGA